MLPIQLKIFLALLLCLPLAAATWNSDGSDSDTQTQINNASSGDTVILPSAGSFYWDTEVLVVNSKWIYLNGNGSTIYRTNNTTTPLLTVAANATAGSHVFGFIFDNAAINQDANVRQVVIGAGTGGVVLQYYNNTNRTTLGGEILLLISGSETNAGFLAYNCEFIADDASEIIHYWGGLAGTERGWDNEITPGGSDMVFIEDCRFKKYDQSDGFFQATSAIQNFYGSRLVFRYNTLDYCQIDVHGNTHPCGRWWEIYGNTINEPATGNQSHAMQIRGGSGVIFSNVVNEPGAGGMSIQLYEDSTPGTCPLVYQIGRGKNITSPPSSGDDQADDPAYVWGNSKGPGTGGPGASCIILDDSYFTSAKPSYTPYTYPHPLRVDGGGEAAGSGKGRGQLGTAGRFRMR